MEQVFGSLNLSKEILLNEMAIILASQQYKSRNNSKKNMLRKRYHKKVSQKGITKR